MRGFLSSVDPVLHLGLGRVETLDSLVIQWSSGGRQVLLDVEVDLRLDIWEHEAH